MKTLTAKERRAIAIRRRGPPRKREPERRNDGRLKMADQIVRCPHCVLDDHFRPMLSTPKGLFICTKCGHSANPEKPEFKCFSQKCGELNRAA